MKMTSFLGRAALACAFLPLAGCIDGPLDAGETEVSRFQGCTRIPVLELPGGTSGALSADDCESEDDGSYVDFYKLHVPRSDLVTITMRSNDIDTYLLLYSPEGAVVAADDDSGGSSTDAQISVRLPGGTYVIAATSYDPGEVGPYTIHVQ